jgi:FkbM family methyltransferase
MISMLKRAALAVVGRTPVGVRAWVYRHPRVWTPLARMLGRLIPAGEATVLEIRVGPNAGMKLAVDRTTPRYYWLDPNYESAVVQVLGDWVLPGMIVADVGAHIGFMTMYLAQRVGSSGTVLSFEPSPAPLAQLRHNIQINSLANVKPMAIALSDNAGQARFVVLPHSTTSRLAGADRIENADAQSIEVQMMRLDELIFGAGGPARLDVLKIDVEGNEGAVLRGASRVMAELRPTMLIEVHTAAALGDCLRQLGAANYQVSALHPNPYYDAALIDSSAAEREASGFSMNHLRCVPR